MKNFKRVTAMISALAMLSTFAACSTDEGIASEAEVTSATTALKQLTSV